MGTILQDTRYALRNFARNPGFTLMVIATLALGIGANTTIFSLIDAVLLKPLPFPEPNRLMLVFETFGKGPDNWNIVSAPNFWDFKRQSRSFESMAIFDSGGRGYNLSATALVAAEVALASIVLCGTGLMIKSMARLSGVDPGLNPKNVLTMTMSVPQQAIYVAPPDLPRFCDDINEYVSAVPGVLSVGAVSQLPFEGNAGRGFQIEGRPLQTRPKCPALITALPVRTISTPWASQSWRDASSRHKMRSARPPSPSSTKPWPMRIGQRKILLAKQYASADPMARA